MDFIKRLIRHIPEKHFKMIRYGGLYARHRKIDKNLYLAVSKEKHHETRYRETAQKYMDNPPEGMSSRDIRRMSEEELQFKRAPTAVFPIKQKSQITC